MSPSDPFRDALNIIKKEWKLLAWLNAIYFCVLVAGVALALISPGLHLSMIKFLGAETIAGQPEMPTAYVGAEAVEAVLATFASSFFTNTLLMITLPSVVFPIWAPIIGATRFFIWGVTYVVPLQGVMTLGNLIPQYIAMLLVGEAYIIAIFACVRQAMVLVSTAGIGFKKLLRAYLGAVAENLKLLIIVALLLAIAALYQVLLIPPLAGIL